MNCYFTMLFFGILFTHSTIWAQSTDSISKINPLHEDVYLHPVDAITPYTLKKGQCIYGQPFIAFPFPGWAFIGITDRLTAQLDLTPWTFGPFTELKKPIPSFNFRYRFNEQKNNVPTIGVETQFVYFWDTLQRFSSKTLTVWENGAYFHFKPTFGYQWKKKHYLNFSVGIDYIGGLIMKNNDSLQPYTASFVKQWNPNYSIGYDFRPSKWISFHIGYSYGATFSYLENVPRKHQINYGFRLAPFYKNKAGFLRCMRFEILAINGYFKDIHAWQSFNIPVYPAYVYWQWDMKWRKKSKNTKT